MRKIERFCKALKQIPQDILEDAFCIQLWGDREIHIQLFHDNVLDLPFVKSWKSDDFVYTKYKMVREGFEIEIITVKEVQS